jgi:hypothetical protein|nr:MAG TPA: hypothetical protein [Caudoviricetes sp.]
MSLQEIKKELVEKEVIKSEHEVIAVRHHVFCGASTLRYEAIVLSENFIPYSVLAHKSGKYSMADYDLREYEEV